MVVHLTFRNLKIYSLTLLKRNIQYASIGIIIRPEEEVAILQALTLKAVKKVQRNITI